MTVIDTTAAHGEFIHPALFYRDDEQYLAGLVPFILEGLELDEPVAVAVPQAKLDLLRPALGAAADQLRLIDMNQAGRNPGRIIPTVLRRFADAHADSHVRIIGEPIWPARSDTEYPACVQHEALINPAFDGRDVTIVCPYDTTGLGERALTDAYATHPLIWDGASRYRSAQYDPDDVITRYNQPLPTAAHADELTVAVPAELGAAREWAAGYARRLGMGPDRLADLELIITELVTNSLSHGVGPSRVQLWRDDEHLTCAVHDYGRLIDPLAGRRPPKPGQFGGRGLLLVHQLADLVRTHATAEGTTQYALMRFTA